MDHRIIQVGREFEWLSSASFCLYLGQYEIQTRLYRALSSWVLEMCKVEDSTASVYKVFQYLMSNSFLWLVRTSAVSVYECISHPYCRHLNKEFDSIFSITFPLNSGSAHINHIVQPCNNLGDFSLDTGFPNLSCTGRPKTDCSIWDVGWMKRNSHFPWYTGYYCFAVGTTHYTVFTGARMHYWIMVS